MRIGVVSVAGDIFPPIRMKYLIERGHDVYYIGILPSLDNPNFRINGFKYETIGARLTKPWLFSMFDAALKVRKTAKKLNLDVLHIIDMAYCLCAPFSGAKATILENNGSDVLIAPNKTTYLKYLYKYCYSHADAVIQDSAIVQKAAINLGANPINNELLELGTDFNVFNLDVKKGLMRARYNIPDSKRIVFSPRSFCPIYNIDVIIRSIPLVKKECKDVVYVFCGYGVKMETELRSLSRTLGVEDDVIFAGIVDRYKELPYFYADADVTVSVPSSDSMPASVVEAMACGSKVVISELPWYHHKFVKDVELVTVPVRDHDILAKAIINLFNNKPFLNNVAVAKKIRKQSDYKQIGEKLEYLYKDLLINKHN